LFEELKMFLNNYHQPPCRFILREESTFYFEDHPALLGAFWSENGQISRLTVIKYCTVRCTTSKVSLILNFEAYVASFDSPYSAHTLMYWIFKERQTINMYSIFLTKIRWVYKAGRPVEAYYAPAGTYIRGLKKLDYLSEAMQLQISIIRPDYQ
jgi:hypothetical protein